MDFRYFISRVRDVKIKDILSFFPMAIAVAVSPIFKKKYGKTWLICEDKNEARDNGYWFYRNVIENHPNQKCIYAINRRSIDYNKIRAIGESVSYGSMRHWIIYFSCEFNISSHKGGKPNPAVCAFIELNHLYNSHTIFLQHGITKDNAKWLYADVSPMDLFITGAKPEYEYINKYFGYKEGVVKLTGFARFDNLHNYRVVKNRIIIMPTWRSWFHFNSRKHDGGVYNFIESPYYKNWLKLLNSDILERLIEEYDLEVMFFPHRNMQKYVPEFKNSVNSKVLIASWEKYDVQELMTSSQMMITDYSSVFFDMIYMKKPIIFFQFDYDEFRANQYDEGYFDYFKNPFGKSFSDCESVLIELEGYLKSGFKCSDEYLKAHAEYFPLCDNNNSERIYEEILNLRNRRKRG